MTIAQAYASAIQTPLDTIEITHSGLTDGVVRFVSGYTDVTATLEDSRSVTFTAIGANVKLSDRSTDGNQELQFALDNTSRVPSNEISRVIDSARASRETPILRYRAYLPADLSTVADGPYIFRVKSSQADIEKVIITASFFYIGNMDWPFKKYDPDKYPGVRYA